MNIEKLKGDFMIEKLNMKSRGQATRLSVQRHNAVVYHFQGTLMGQGYKDFADPHQCSFQRTRQRCVDP